MTQVLVADDSETILLLLRTRLEMEGYEVTTVTDGVEAMTALAGMDPDVILLDAMMPRMSGVEALQKLRASGSKIPVLVISAHLDAQEPERMIEAGANGCVPKPFEWDELIARIEELVD